MLVTIGGEYKNKYAAVNTSNICTINWHKLEFTNVFILSITFTNDRLWQIKYTSQEEVLNDFNLLLTKSGNTKGQ